MGERSRGSWADEVSQDAAHAARSLRRTPVFTAVVVLSVALGIGASTAVFTLANAMLLARLPYPAADRLVVAYRTVTRDAAARTDTALWAFAAYESLRARVTEFEDVGFSAWQDMNLRVPGDAPGDAPRGAERVRVEAATASLLSTIGVRPLGIGRTFKPDEDVPGVAHSVALVSHRLWRRAFGGQPVEGRVVHLGMAPVTIIGVMPPEFTGFAGGADLWVPLQVMPRIQPGARWVERLDAQYGTVIARLRPGVTESAAADRLAAVARDLAREMPERFGPRRAAHGTGVMRLDEARRHPLVRPMLLVLSVAVGGVLLIVCANVAGLVLARGRARETEFGVRLSLGASPARVARQVLTENVVLAALGVLPGIAIAYGGATALARLRPQLPKTWVLVRGTDLLEGVSLAPDWRVLGFALALTLLVGLAFGVGPAYAAARTRASALLMMGGGSGARRAHGRRALVVAQIALATALLASAGLMARSVRALLHTDLGFDPDGLVVMHLASTDTSAAAQVRRTELFSRLASLPGVTGVATHGCTLFDRDCLFTVPLLAEESRGADPARAPEVEVHFVSRDYLRVMGIPLAAGRDFGAREESGEGTGVLLSESAARRVWADAGRPAVGRRVAVHGPQGPLSEVIGVVRDVRFSAPHQPPRPVVYLGAGQSGGGPQYSATLLLRIEGAPGTTIAAVRRELARADPGLAIYGETTAAALLRVASSSTRFVAVLLAGFALAAAFLAALGIYGVVAHLVTQRRREFGIRLALGASPGWIMRHVVRQGAALTAAGLALGVVGSLAASRMLAGFLHGVGRADAMTYAATLLLVGAIGVLAAFIPGRRATRVDPAMTLRGD